MTESAHEFAQAEPFPHVVLDNFLDAALSDRLIDEFPRFEEKKALNEMGVVGRKAVNTRVAELGPAYRQFDAMMRDSAFLERIAKMTGIENLLYDPDYIGGGTHENLDGQELDLHVDFNYHPSRLWHRRLNLIVFLNREWDSAWGGCLELHRDPWNQARDEVRSVTPIANRAVLFETTETSWHGFGKIGLPEDRPNLSRRSLAVYFYTKDRPISQSAASHGTIYVPRPLPAHLTAGYTLQQSDVDALHESMERRNGQLRFLYERELEFSEVLSGMTRSLSFRVGRMLTWPLRRALRR